MTGPVTGWNADLAATAPDDLRLQVFTQSTSRWCVKQKDIHGLFHAARRSPMAFERERSLIDLCGIGPALGIAQVLWFINGH